MATCLVFLKGKAHISYLFLQSFVAEVLGDPVNCREITNTLKKVSVDLKASYEKPLEAL